MQEFQRTTGHPADKVSTDPEHRSNFLSPLMPPSASEAKELATHQNAQNGLQPNVVLGFNPTLDLGTALFAFQMAQNQHQQNQQAALFSALVNATAPSVLSSLTATLRQAPSPPQPLSLSPPTLPAGSLHAPKAMHVNPGHWVGPSWLPGTSGLTHTGHPLPSLGLYPPVRPSTDAPVSVCPTPTPALSIYHPHATHNLAATLPPTVPAPGSAAAPFPYGSVLSGAFLSAPSGALPGRRMASKLQAAQRRRKGSTGDTSTTLLATSAPSQPSSPTQFGAPAASDPEGTPEEGEEFDEEGSDTGEGILAAAALEHSSASFNLHLAALRRYVSLRNRIPKSGEVAEGLKLGAWCASVRMKWKNGKMPAAEREALDAVPGWTWNAKASQLQEMHEISASTHRHRITLLKLFVKEQGRLPRDKETFRGVPLGSWCSMQRYHFKRGQLSSDVISEMEEIPEWIWNLRDKRNQVLKQATQETFQSRLPLLVEFVQLHQRAPKQSEEFRGVKLGWWADSQRKRYRRGTLSQEEMEALEAVEGWTWDPLLVMREQKRVERERRDSDFAEREAMAIATLQGGLPEVPEEEEEEEEWEEGRPVKRVRREEGEEW